MIKLKIIALITLFVFSNDVFSQSGVVHDIGVIGGPVQFRSDYGIRDNTETNLKNMGFGIGVVDYLNYSFNDNENNYLKEHFRIRAEFSFTKAYLRQYGPLTEKNTIGGQQLAAMRGSTQIINIGAQIEWHPIHIHDFENTIGAFSPYIALGGQIGYYSAIASSTLGSLGNAATTLPKYLQPSDGRPHGYSTESKAVLSVVTSVGTRYKLTYMSDLVVDLRFQSFNSDWVDGLSPNKKTFKENKNNDSLLWLTVGYIFYLEEAFKK